MPKILVSPEGLTSCPSCLSHITVDDEPESTQCPFCGERLVDAARGSRPEPTEGKGGGVLGILRASRSGLLVGALVGSTALVGCVEGEENNETDMEIENVDNNTPVQDYGGAPIDNNENYNNGADMGTDAGDTTNDDAGS
jgi:predicted RNA-binding Zn-ribbon protein involved in translation (DUF1610 family)